MTEDDFNDWLDSPTTKYIMSYWDDSAIEEVNGLSDMLMSGSILSDVEQARVAAVHMTLTQVRDINYSEIIEFYKGDENEGTRQSSNHIT